MGWGPSIFPKEAFEDRKLSNPGKSNLENLLGIQATIPKELLNNNAGTSFTTTEPVAKKQKTNYQITQTFVPQNKQGGNKRGNRGGKRNKGKNNSQQSSINNCNKGRSNQT